ncbi:MAG TPA: carboxyl transferase domain-containing protein [Gammaproteobacteria bacterium]|nr:carboxyl transferase domain-containing protein [Gammaproteobacteria bacterium]
MSLRKLLIANRGEIAIRIARAAAELGIRTVAVHSDDDERSRHVAVADEAVALGGSGPSAYLDAERIVNAARDAGCDAIHPGYGFLSENAGFARACADADVVFVGPEPASLELFGDKSRARALARRCDVPLLPGTNGPTSLEEAHAFLEGLGEGAAVMVKALAGGGGRGIRAVRDPEELEDAFRRCESEAKAAFGSGDLYVERLIRHARHVEVQVVGDGTGEVVHLGERECSIQRRHQKLVEVAPSPALTSPLRSQLTDAALRMAGETAYASLGTFEFLVDADAPDEAPAFAFMEANPRLQVEHTVTEEVTGVDLVKTQLRLAAGATLADLGLRQEHVPPPAGYAIQLRVNLETIGRDGEVRPSGGTLSAFEPPSGPGVRVDTFGYAGYTTSPAFDSLLAKLIAHGHGEYREVVARARLALSEFRVEGVATNIPFLYNLLGREDFVEHRIYTRFVEDNLDALLTPPDAHARRYFSGSDAEAASGPAAEAEAPAGTEPVRTPMQGRVVSIDVAEGDLVHPGQQLAVVEAMKMEYVVAAGEGGSVRRIAAAAGDNVFEAQPLLFLEPTDVAGPEGGQAEDVDLDAVRPDLQEVIDRHAMGLDESRPEAVQRRRKVGHRTARENLAELLDPGSFVEYGSLAIAAQRSRRSLDDLIRNTPADGLITGVGTVNGALFDESRSRCMVLHYDYSVLAGTQGKMNHKKTDRMLQLAEDWRLPIVFFAEGGGGRPGDTDAAAVAGLDTPSFKQYARLSGLVPRISIVAGRCFAGNAAIAGCSDVIVATRDTTIGMGGPAMIEGGGLGVFRPEEVGPVSVQEDNGVLDLVVEDEAEAVAAAKQLLSYFQGPVTDWDCADQRRLRRAIPENRLRVYDVRRVIDILADSGSVTELRRRFAPGMITAFVRIEGHPMGLIANNPQHLAGAIDADGADKAARFMQLCDAFDIPILTLCDTPGIMVGPEAEKTALVRHASRMFLAGASVSVPIYTIVLRKGYGLGAQAMAGGSFHAPFFIVSWPTGEFGGMGLEGAVRLGYRKELEAVEDPDERQRLFERMVAAAYEHGKALNMASYLEIDEVIDPVESRRWIARGLASRPPAARGDRRRPLIDAW